MRSRPEARLVAGSKPVLLAALFWITVSPPAATAAQTVKPSHVLALYWYDKDFPSNVAFDRGVQAAFRNEGVQYYAEYFEPNRFPGEGQAVVLRDYLRRKYSERKIDVLIAMSAVAADFLLKYRDDLFPDTPIVLHIFSGQLRDRSGGTSFPRVVSDNVHARTLDLALRLHNSTKHDFVINGTPERDESVESLLKEYFREFETRVEITYLTDLPLDELIARVKAIPEQSLIWYSRQDYQEPSISMFEVLALIVASANVPIYSTGAFVGYGTIGGYTVNTYECGVQAAGMALRIMSDRLPQPAVIEVPSSPSFDWRQLQRWGINEDALPTDSEILFKQLTVFQQYQWRIIGFLALCAVQSFFIAALLGERRKRRRARTELRERLEFETLLSELSADMATLPAGTIDEGIDHWLTKLAAFLGADSAILLRGTPPGQEPSVLTIPIHVSGSTWTLSFYAPPSSRVWSADLHPRIRLAGEMLAGALVFKVSAEALRASQERYKLATASGRVIVWDWDFETSNFYFEPLLKLLLGYEDQDIGNTFEDWVRLIHPEDVNAVLTRLRHHVDSGEPRFEIEHRLVQKDGGIRWFLASGTVIQNEQGRMRIIGTDTDITERKLAAQELQNLSTRLIDMQDRERRRIARELHDGTAQNLLVVSLDLQALKSKCPPALAQELSECQTLCEQSLQEIRTLAYVLHPPMLDEGDCLRPSDGICRDFPSGVGLTSTLLHARSDGFPRELKWTCFVLFKNACRTFIDTREVGLPRLG